MSIEKGSIGHLEASQAIAIHGGAALHLQMLHPLVAEGVMTTGALVDNPKERLGHTVAATSAIAAGDERTIARVNGIHRRISGTLPQKAGKWEAGTPFKANDPELLMWVFATLVETRLSAYEEIHTCLSPEVKEAFYNDKLITGQRLGIPEDYLPADYEAFTDYYTGMVGSIGKSTDTLAMTPAAAAVSEALLGMRFGRVPVREIGKVASTALMPSTARQAYELPWGRSQQLTWGVGKRALRLLDRHHD